MLRYSSEVKWLPGVPLEVSQCVWGTKQAKEGKLGLRNTKTGWFNVKKKINTPPKEDILRIKSVNMGIVSV